MEEYYVIKIAGKFLGGCFILSDKEDDAIQLSHVEALRLFEITEKFFPYVKRELKQFVTLKRRTPEEQQLYWQMKLADVIQRVEKIEKTIGLTITDEDN